MIHFTAKTEYACLAMLDLAATHLAREPLQVRRIADAHGIPQHFLVQILLQLKKNGLVKSTRGASGGYRLTKPPHQISVWEVAMAMEGYDAEVATQTGGPAADVLRETWNRAAARSREVLEKTSLARLAERVRKESHDMYYI